MPLPRRLICAVPAVAVAGAVGWLPPGQRPPLMLWFAATALLAGPVCAATRSRPGVAGLCAAATVLGALVQLRLGQAGPGLVVVAALAAVSWVAAARLGGSGWFERMLADSYRCRVLAVAAIGGGIGLRGLTLLGPNPAAGTLPLVPVQVGELTRYLVAAGVAVGVAELAACRRGYWRHADGVFRAVLCGLAGCAVGTLVLLHDLGPAVLLVVGVSTALVHSRGLRPLPVIAAAAGLALAFPLIAASDIVRSRLEHVLDPDPQLRSALIAAGSGGLIGPGPGRSPLVDGIPAIGSDFALAALIADLGALVVLPVVVALLVNYSGLVRAGARRPGPAGAVATALSAMLLVQAGWNALGTVAVLPLTGLNQPFLGMSGASLVTSALVVGLVLGILDGPWSAREAPGTAAVAGLTRAGTAAVVLMLVVATGLLAVTPKRIGDLEQTRMPRGVLWTADGQVVSLDGHHQRTYPAGVLYADLGRDTWGYSHRGIDATNAEVLTCGGRLHLADWIASLLHTVCKPADVVTSVDSRVQTALRQALAGRTGEAVVLDARTGSVLGLYSSGPGARGAPSTTVRSPDAGDAAPGGAPASYVASPARFQQRPPGSTMKLVTAAASLLAGVDYGQAPAGEFVGADRQRLLNDDRETCPSTDVRVALAYSCNSVFGWAANAVGPVALRRVAATYFGADQPFALEGGDAVGLSTGLSGTGLTSTGRVSAGALARTGIGQESVRSTVLGIAVATAVVANSAAGSGAGATAGTGADGSTPWPRLTAATCPDPATADDEPVPTSAGPAVGQPLPARVGRVIYDGMRMAAVQGTARALGSPPGREIAAKTGTAQTTGTEIDSWVTAIVDHRYVLTMVIANAPSEGAAVRAVAPVLATLPTERPPLACPSTNGILAAPTAAEEVSGDR